jgi:NhaA family Na+:H+ antiporter
VPADRLIDHGWAIPCATNIAFSAMVALLLFPAAHPAIPFLLLLAIADEALGLIILAVFFHLDRSPCGRSSG